MRIKTYLSFLAACLIVCSWTFNAQAKGSSMDGAQFLNLTGSAKAIALGGAMTAIGQDLHGLQSNPASLSAMNRKSALFSQGLLFGSMKLSYASYAQPTVYGVPVVEFLNVSYGDFNGYNESRENSGTFAPSNTTYGLGWGAREQELWGNKLRLGVMARYLKSNGKSDSANGFSFSAGSVYHFVKHDPNINASNENAHQKGFVMGASINHVGPELKYANETASLPTNARLALGYTGQEFRTLNVRANYALDGAFPKQGTPHLLAGAELFLYDLLNLQIGYDGAENISNRFRYGIGIGVSAIQVSYALSTNPGLGSSHRFTLELRFGQGVWNFGKTFGSERFVHQNTLNAYHYLKKGDTAKAAKFAKRALKRRPNHQPAMGIIAEIEKKNLASMASDIYYEALKSYHSNQFSDAHDKMQQVKALDPKNQDYSELNTKIESAYAQELKQKAGQIVTESLDQLESEVQDYLYLNLPQEGQLIAAAQSAREALSAGDYQTANSAISQANSLITGMTISLQDRARERERLINEERRRQSLNKIQDTLAQKQGSPSAAAPDKAGLETFARAEEHMQNGRFDEAIRMFKEALTKNKNYGPGKVALRNSLKCRGIIYFRAHEYKKALTDFEDAYKLDTSDSVLRKWISDLKASPVLSDLPSGN